MMTEADQYNDIRRHVEKRLKRKRDIYISVAAYVVTNVALWFFFRQSWVLWVTLGGGIGITALLYDYYNKYGPGARNKEAVIQREVEREMALRGVYEKPKNDVQMRLTDDGELEEVLEDEISLAEKRKRN
ncbi:MAG: 2TM domain-containing protein [Anaerolineae bacterium]|nr:2TM domain-containing protein [Anaerolineae bacterium]